MTRRTCILPALVVLLASPVLAQQTLPLPRLEAVYPLGAKAGGEVQVTFTGEALEGQQQLLFTHAGITGEPVINPADAFYPEARPALNKFTVRVAADVPPGAYEVRVANKLGLSNARVFFVGDLPESPEADSRDDKNNNDPAGANELAVNSVVNGQCDPRTYDYFRFTAKAGKR